MIDGAGQTIERERGSRPGGVAARPAVRGGEQGPDSARGAVAHPTSAGGDGEPEPARGNAAGAAAPGPPTVTGGRERILREARRLFVAQGFAAVSMQQIADAAGVNKATLYHHMADKEALFLAVVGQERARTEAAVAEALGAGGPLRARLLAVAERFFAGEQADIGRLMVDLRQHVDPARRDAFFCDGTPPWVGLRRAIAEAVAAGEARPIDPETAARLFFIAVMSEVGRLRSGDPAPADPAALVDLLLDGIAAR